MFKKIWNWLTQNNTEPSQAVEVDWNIRSVDVSPNIADWVDEDFQQGSSLPAASGRQIEFYSYKSGDPIPSPLKIEEADNAPCTAASDSELEKKYEPASNILWESLNSPELKPILLYSDFISFSDPVLEQKPKKARKKTAQKSASKKFPDYVPDPSRPDVRLTNIHLEKPKKAKKKSAKKTKKGKKRAT